MSILKTIGRGIAAYYTGGASEAYFNAYDAQQNNKAITANNRTNNQLQYDFAQKGIQWRVNDAKKAGIHPLAALGANTNSPSFAGQPVSGSTTGDFVKARNDSYMKATHELSLKSMEADNVLKLAQASKLAKETQQINSVQPMFRQVYDNNPDSKTYGKKIWIPHEDIAESMEGTGAFWSSVYSSSSSALFNKQKQLEKQRRIKEHRKKTKQRGKYGYFRMKVPDGTGGYKYVHKKSPYPYADD